MMTINLALLGSGLLSALILFRAATSVLLQRAHSRVQTDWRARRD